MGPSSSPGGPDDDVGEAVAVEAPDGHGPAELVAGLIVPGHAARLLGDGQLLGARALRRALQDADLAGDELGVPCRRRPAPRQPDRAAGAFPRERGNGRGLGSGYCRPGPAYRRRGRTRCRCSPRPGPRRTPHGSGAGGPAGSRPGWQAFPPRLAGQPICYPVLNEEYATKIARNWNTKDAASGCVGYVLRFEVERPYVDQFGIHRVGGGGMDELWVPADELAEFNRHIVGPIEVTAEYR